MVCSQCGKDVTMGWYCVYECPPMPSQIVCLECEQKNGIEGTIPIPVWGK